MFESNKSIKLEEFCDNVQCRFHQLHVLPGCTDMFISDKSGKMKPTKRYYLAGIYTKDTHLCEHCINVYGMLKGREMVQYNYDLEVK